ncbi:MAG: SpoIIE family protein phosphatase [Oscillospiraceae bacterium]|nr:SpoIIE family protein phosphatase [Oscillospiraceae bacterium]
MAKILIHQKSITLFKFEKIFSALTVMMIGVLTAKTTVFDQCFPFGLAVVAATPKWYSIFALVGTIFGYISGHQTSSNIRYIAAVLSILAIRWALSDVKKIKQHPVYIFFITFVPSFVTGISLKLATGLNFDSFTICILESILASGTAYVFKRAFSVNLHSKKFDVPMFTCCAFIFGIIILPFINLKFYSISIANAILISIVLICAHSFKAVGGALSGLGLGILQTLISGSTTFTIFAPFGGLLAGFFSNLGKTAVCVVFLFSNLIIHYQLKNSVSMSEICEILIGLIFYCIIPKSFSLKTFISVQERISSDAICSFISQNLTSIGYAFSKTKEFIEEVSSHFGNHDSKILVENNLGIFSNICENLSEKIEKNITINEENSSKIRLFIYKNYKLETKVTFWKTNHDFVQIEWPGYEPRDIEPLAEEISYICNKNFAKPEIFKLSDRNLIRFYEKPIYKVRIDTCQHARNNGRYCGDSFNYFPDGLGNFFVILSDGMGTGSEAAVDGKMTTEVMSYMIQSRVNLKDAIDLTNASLIVKSKDESLSTLDIFCFDLFTGEACFTKAGAAKSYIKKDNEIIKISSETLPIGIFSSSKAQEINYQISERDIILIVSDGVTELGDEWIAEEMESYEENLSKRIVNSAKSRRSFSNDDDITAICVRVSK